jgi:hypothetical protein
MKVFMMEAIDLGKVDRDTSEIRGTVGLLEITGIMEGVAMEVVMMAGEGTTFMLIVMMRMRLRHRRMLLLILMMGL